MALSHHCAEQLDESRNNQRQSGWTEASEIQSGSELSENSKAHESHHPPSNNPICDVTDVNSANTTGCAKPAVELQPVQSNSLDEPNNETAPQSAHGEQGHPPTPSKDRDKYCELMMNPMFWTRCLTFLFSLILLALSIGYCIAGLSTVTMELLTECKPKTREEIWRHSLESAKIVDGEPVLSRSSQFGETEGCWTTKNIILNTDSLWYSNQYLHRWQLSNVADPHFILFAVMFVFILCVTIFTAWSMISDCIAVKHDMLHAKCSKFKPSEETVWQKETTSDPQLEREVTDRERSRFEHGNECSIASLMSRLYGLYWKYMGYDTSGWISSSILSQMLELTVQSYALLLYNGYNVLNPDDVILAQKPEFIRSFAIILGVNSIIAGLSWLCYAAIPGRCYGLTFLLIVFLVDQIADLFYTLFPFIVVIYDEYNANTDNLLVPLGVLENGTVFIASFFPLVLLTTHLAMYSVYAQWELREQYHAEWMMEQHLKPALSKFVNRKTMKNLMSAKTVTPYKSWIEMHAATGPMKQISLIFIAAMYFGFGIAVILLTMKYANDAETHCGSFSASTFFVNGTLIDRDLSKSEIQTLSTTPELFVWDQCLYKVYPFTNDEHYRCQCRVFVIDWDEDLESTASERAQYFNLSQVEILESALTHWVMLEKFKTSNELTVDVPMTMTRNMFRSVGMKAFEMKGINILNGTLPHRIDQWIHLEHLAFSNMEALSLPNSTGTLSNLKSMSFSETDLSSIPYTICELENLEVLKFNYENLIVSVPKCMGNLQNLKLLAFDNLLFLEDIPLSIFNLPNLKILSLHQSAITLDSLLDYNMPSNISMNETDWFVDNFQYRDNKTEYWLTSSNICVTFYLDPTVFIKTGRFMGFLSDSCNYPIDIDVVWGNYHCPAYKLGDGKCDGPCNLQTLQYDASDCIQMCVADGLTNCTEELLFGNHNCDEPCDNKYCFGYNYETTSFLNPMTRIHENETLYAADSTNCPYIVSSDDYPFCNDSAADSIYLDPNVPSENYDLCLPQWIGDGICDDSCRVRDCGDDAGDCDPGNACKDGGLCDTLWLTWSFFGVDKVNHSVACEEMWPVMKAALHIRGEEQCEDLVILLDYNNDSHTSFREIIPFGYQYATNEDLQSRKSQQINCSECCGMNVYNI